MKMPLAPPSRQPPRTRCPPSGPRTPCAPQRRKRRMPRSTTSRVHDAALGSLRSNRFEDSTPISTASFPRLIARRACRAVDQAEPAAARPAALRVHVVAQGLQPADLEPVVSVSSRVRPDRLDPAQLVLNGLRHHEPLARQPCPLEPGVVGLLVRVGAVHGPAGERRPAGCRGCRCVPAQQVAGDVERSVGAVDVLIVPERLRDAEPVERLAGDHAAAGTHVGRDEGEGRRSQRTAAPRPPLNGRPEAPTAASDSDGSSADA